MYLIKYMPKKAVIMIIKIVLKLPIIEPISTNKTISRIGTSNTKIVIIFFIFIISTLTLSFIDKISIVDKILYIKTEK